VGGGGRCGRYDGGVRSALEKERHKWGGVGLVSAEKKASLQGIEGPPRPEKDGRKDVRVRRKAPEGGEARTGGGPMVRGEKKKKEKHITTPKHTGEVHEKLLS